MATLKPFAALRPSPNLAAKICELPYDVMSSAEAKAIAHENPYSFLHISKPEIDLEPDIDVYSDAVYAKGAENFRLLQEQDALLRDAKPAYYLYRQIMGSHEQTGLVAAASCSEYAAGIIRKHELTRPEKENDRVRHIQALKSQTGPVFITYTATKEMNALTNRVIGANEPDIDFCADDNVKHTAWVIDADDDIDIIQQHFANIERLYIADGHHRSAAAARVDGEGDFLVVAFPHDQMQVLAYNRALKDLNDLNTDEFLTKLESIFEISESDNGDCAAKNELALYLDGRWRRLVFKPDVAATERLDVTLLQRHVLGQVLGIDDPRTNDRIAFIGGIRGTAELSRRVDSGEFACAFSMFPTSIEDLMAIADADELMPPKSTWFEPKLRDGMFCHMI